FKRCSLAHRRELHAREPDHVRLGPSLLARIMQATPQQERRDLLALAAQILNRRAPCPAQITHRLVTFIRNPDRRQIAGAQLLRQTERVAPVGLHPVARLLWDQRRRNHNALMTQALDLPIEPIPSRTRLVAERQPLISGGKLLHQLGCRYSGIVDLAAKPHLTRTSGVRDRDCIAQLRRIKSDESFGMMVHDSPSLPEALPGLSG